jgi:hypothetical protein
MSWEEQRRINQEVDRRLRDVLRAIGGLPVRWNVGAGNNPGIRRVIVVEPNVATLPVVQLVKTVEAGSDLGIGDAYPVVSLCRMGTGKIFYVFRPTNGVKSSPTYNPGGGAPAEPIPWRDCRLPGLYDVNLIPNGGTEAANPADRKYDVQLVDHSTKLNDTPMEPINRFLPGGLADAETGTVYIDESGEPTRLRADELAQVSADCGGGEEV